MSFTTLSLKYLIIWIVKFTSSLTQVEFKILSNLVHRKIQKSMIELETFNLKFLDFWTLYYTYTVNSPFIEKNKNIYNLL